MEKWEVFFSQIQVKVGLKDIINFCFTQGKLCKICFDLFRVEFVDINYITEKFRKKIEEMKKNFARVNENFQIGIDGAEGKWGYWPTDKYTHVRDFLDSKRHFCTGSLFIGFVFHLSVLSPGFPVRKVPHHWCWHTICLQHQPPLWRIR